jgi:hypothetical protein
MVGVVKVQGIEVESSFDVVAGLRLRCFEKFNITC